MKCAKCGERISYNSYKKVKGKYYCLDCKLETQVEKAAKEIQKYGIVGFQGNKNIGRAAMKQCDTECFSKNTGLGGKALKSKKKTRKHEKTSIDNGYIAKNLYDPGANPQPKKPKKVK